MFSNNDLDDAVSAGVLSPEAATAFRDHLERRAALPAVDEEHFRLLSGFNDIFVSIASVILLFSVGFIGQSIGSAILPHGNPWDPTPGGAIAGLAVAACAWGLALFFTAKRRMALPSIILLLAFVGGLFAASGFFGVMLFGKEGAPQGEAVGALIAAVSAGVGAIGAWLHWRRFHVPITVAAGAAALSGLLLSLIASALGPRVGSDVILSLVLVLGLGVFVLAMRWDTSDPTRMTRRSDVAFWLHLLAAPMIVHPVFALMGLTNGAASPVEAMIVVVLYIALGITALAIDRRALLVSALAYVLFALSSLFRQFGAIELSVALTALVIGSVLLLLSAFWHQARVVVVNTLPAALRGYLPATDRVATISPQPAA